MFHPRPDRSKAGRISHRIKFDTRSFFVENKGNALGTSLVPRVSFGPQEERVSSYYMAVSFL